MTDAVQDILLWLVKIFTLALERTFDGLRGFTACLEDAHEKGLIYAAGVWQKDEVKRTRYMKEAYIMGKNV